MIDEEQLIEKGDIQDAGIVSDKRWTDKERDERCRTGTNGSRKLDRDEGNEEKDI